MSIKEVIVRSMPSWIVAASKVCPISRVVVCSCWCQEGERDGTCRSLPEKHKDPV